MSTLRCCAGDTVPLGGWYCHSAGAMPVILYHLAGGTVIARVLTQIPCTESYRGRISIPIVLDSMPSPLRDLRPAAFWRDGGTADRVLRVSFCERNLCPAVAEDAL
jgi:hypothetical protein